MPITTADTLKSGGQYPSFFANEGGGGLHIVGTYAELSGITSLRKYNASFIPSVLALVLADTNNGGNPNLYFWNESGSAWVELNTLNIATISGGLEYLSTIDASDFNTIEDGFLVDGSTAASSSEFYIYQGASSIVVNNVNLAVLNGLTINAGDWIVATSKTPSGTEWRRISQSASALSWNSITDKPDVSLVGHTHVISDVTGLAAELAAKLTAADKTQIPLDADSADYDTGGIYEANANKLPEVLELLQWVEAKIAVATGVTPIIVDDTLDVNSTNAIENQAVALAIQGLQTDTDANATELGVVTAQVSSIQSDVSALETSTSENKIKKLAEKTVAEVSSELRDGVYTVSATLTAVYSGQFIEITDDGTISNVHLTEVNGKAVYAGDYLMSGEDGVSQKWYLISNKVGTSGSSTAWGDITGTLSAQTDLQSALDSKIEGVAWGEVTGTLSAQTDLQSALDDKSTLDADVTFNSVQLIGGTGTQGKVSWNTDENTLDLIQNGTTLQLGQEVQYNVRNNTGSTIANGTPVMATGTIGASGRITIAPMDLTSAANAKYFLGVTAEEILNGVDGKVTSFGKVRQLDTTGTAYSEVWADGDVIYLSTSTAGALTKVKPTSGVDIPMAFVIYANANGTLFVRATNGVLSEESYYDNATSGLTAVNVQDAIDEVVVEKAGLSQTDFIGGVIEAPADQDYKLVVNLPYGATITETTTISTAGTCTATFKIGTTALGGTANSVSTTEDSQTHSSANVASAGDDIVVTISANSGCEFLSFTIKFTRTLS